MHRITLTEKQIGVLLLFIISTAVYAVNLGFSISGFYLIILVLSLLNFSVYAKNFELNLGSIQIDGLLKITFLFFTILLFALNVVDTNGQLSLAMWISRLSLTSVILISILFFVEGSTSKFLSFFVRRKFVLLLFFSLVIQLTALRIVKIPDIDVFQVLRYGPPRLLRLQNPYETSLTSERLKSEDFGYSFYAYGPTSIYSFLPFDVIFKDPRYLLIVANFSVAFCLFKISRKIDAGEQIPQLLSLIYLFNPRQIYFLTLSHTDILITALVALGLLFYVNRKLNALAVFLALAVGVKIFYALPYVFFLKNKKLLNLRFILAGFSVTVLLHLPFILHNYQAFYKSIVDLNVVDGGIALLERYTLTFWAFLYTQFNFFPTQNVMVAVIIIISLFYWLTIRPVINMSSALVIVSMIFLTGVFLGPLGFSNYYFSASQLLLFAFAFSGLEKNNEVKKS